MTLSLLLIEDDPDDVLLIQNALTTHFAPPAILVFKQVWTEAMLLLALQGRWDVVISDFRLPGFTWPRPLEVIRHNDPLVPIILISGTLPYPRGLSQSVGAVEYISKADMRLLGPAVERQAKLVYATRANTQATHELKDTLRNKGIY